MDDLSMNNQITLRLVREDDLSMLEEL